VALGEAVLYAPVSSTLYNVARGDSHEITATLGMMYRISKR
jgi:hypothetical protein